MSLPALAEPTAWQTSWDRQQEHYMPDREQRFDAMLDLVEAVAGPAPRVLDLAAGTGSITARLLARLPEARSVAVDVDPVLQAIARATFDGDDRARIVTADLADPGWAGAIGESGFDAVLTATALHWLAPDDLRRVYRDAFGLLRPGGVLVNADHMPDDGLPTAAAAMQRLDRERRAAATAAGRPSWESWWEEVRRHPELRDLVAARDRVFAGSHHRDHTPSVSWHVEALRAAGFGEAGVIWRGGNDAAVTGVRLGP